MPLFDFEAMHLIARCKTLFKRSKKVSWVRLLLLNECHIVGRDLILDKADEIINSVLLSLVSREFHFVQTFGALYVL